MAALGVTLGLICALFPWYIFFNPDEFGMRAMKFAGNGEVTPTGPITLEPQPERVGAPSSSEEIPPMKLDLFATGTRQAGRRCRGARHAGLVASSPFPSRRR